MTSFVSNLLYKSADTLDNLPFIGSSRKSINVQHDQHAQHHISHSSPQLPPPPPAPSTVLYDIPPPYNPNRTTTYTKLVDKLIDKTSSNLGYRKDILQGIRLIEIAIDEFDSGNEAIALDIYLSGLDKIIMALPNLRDYKTKEALQEKLASLENRLGIINKHHTVNNQHMESSPTDRIPPTTDNLITKLSTLSNLLAPTWLLTILNKDQDQVICSQEENSSTAAGGGNGGDSLLKFKRLSRAMTDIIVECVVLFKQTPIPGLLYLLFSYFLHLILWLDHHFQVVDKVQNFGLACVKSLLNADEKYHLHEFASEALYTLISASLKAIVAYKEAPGYITQDELQNSWLWSAVRL